ncbi:MAG: DEAD/DEAH box helicase [Bacteroidota bacterium]
MQHFSRIIQYFKACYQLDSRAFSVLNFMGSKVQLTHVMDCADALEGKLERVPVSTDWGNKVIQKLLLTGKEKALYAGAFFLTGTTTAFGRKAEVLAPLLLIPAQLIEEEEVIYLELDFFQTILNPAFVQCLKKNAEEQEQLYDQLSMQLPFGAINFAHLHQIEEALQQFFPTLDKEKVGQFPTLIGGKALAKERRSDHFQVIPSFILGIVDKPFGVRGILTELDEMAQQNDFNPALYAAFGFKERQQKMPEGNVYAPVCLSERQERIFHAALHFRQTVVVGPPGTGKSFTIAALAADHLQRGKSVLIASRNNQAVDVVADKLERDMQLPNIVVRAGRRDYKNQLRRRIKDLQQGIGLHTVPKGRVAQLNWERKRLQKEVRQIEEMLLIRKVNERKRGAILQGRRSLWNRWRVALLKRWVSRELSVSQLVRNLLAAERQLRKTIVQLIQGNFQNRLYKSRTRDWETFRKLEKALRTRSGTQKENLFQDFQFSKVLEALPIWVVNSSDIHHVLPLEKSLFDLVIIDEASQCDIASSLPLLFRARQAVIVGDPKQLRHISFLSKLQQQALADQFQVNEVIEPDLLDYRSLSLLDLVQNTISQPDQMHFLDEHYRSAPSIIQFSNQHFYSNALRIMTASPHQKIEQRVFIHQCGGKRLKSGVNKKEAFAIIEKVKSIAQAEEPLAAELKQTIGILSPFSKQVAFLRKQIEEQCTAAEIQAHRILVGSPFAFQGEERDVMLLSFTVDKDTHPSTFIYLNREDVLNVSITRARSAQHLFISFEEAHISSNTLFGKYLGFVGQTLPATASRAPTYPTDNFVQEVLHFVKELGVEQVFESYTICGVMIDLVVIRNNQTYCIDLIGYDGPFGDENLIEEHKILNRLGISIFPLTYSSWMFDRPRVEQELHHFLNRS